jgi:hypothetical protein
LALLIAHQHNRSTVARETGALRMSADSEGCSAELSAATPLKRSWQANDERLYVPL